MLDRTAEVSVKVGENVHIPTCDDARSLSSHDSLRKSSQESRASQGPQHGGAHHLLEEQQRGDSATHRLDGQEQPHSTENKRRARGWGLGSGTWGRDLGAYLSGDLGAGGSSSYCSSSRKSSSSCGGEEGHRGCYRLAHSQVLTPQVKEVHGGHGVLSRLGLVVLCRQKTT